MAFHAIGRGSAYKLSARFVATFPAAPPLAVRSHWTGRVVPKWTRWGWWNEAGTELTVTRIL